MKNHSWIVVGRRASLTVCRFCRMVRLSKSPASMRRARRACQSGWTP